MIIHGLVLKVLKSLVDPFVMSFEWPLLNFLVSDLPIRFLIEVALEVFNGIRDWVRELLGVLHGSLLLDEL